MDLQAVKAASRAELAECAVAAAGNARDLVADAELLAEAGRNGRAYALAVLSIEEAGKAAQMATLAAMPASVKARAPLRRMVEWHAMKQVGGLLLAVLPVGSVAARISAMTSEEVAECLSVLAPADESDRIKRGGLYVDLERDGIHTPSEVTGTDLASQLDRARRAAAMKASVILEPGFRAWLADPPDEGVELAQDLFTALTEAGYSRTPMAAAHVIREAVSRFRERREPTA
jgi:AbiV family abortive infection protein